MTASSQTPPPALPPESPYSASRWPDPAPLQAAVASYAMALPMPAGSSAPVSADVPEYLVVDRPEPLLPMCVRCGNRKDPLAPHGEERYASGAQVLVCSKGCPSSPRHAATKVLAAAMKGGHTAPAELADAEESAGILFDPQRAQDIATAASAQARAQCAAELRERGEQLAIMTGFKHRLDAVMRLCEGRPGDDAMLVREIHGAVFSGRSPVDDIPMTLAWNGSVDLPDGGAREGRAIVKCTTAHGGRADLVLVGEQRAALAGLLDTEVRDIHAKCPTEGCGTDHDLDASDLFGWSRLEVASLGDGPRWYCSDMCVVDALARTGHDLAAADRTDELGGEL